MSFEQLMQNAYKIQAKAIAKSMEHHGVRPAPKPGDPAFAPKPGEDEKRANIIAGFADAAPSRPTRRCGSTRGTTSTKSQSTRSARLTTSTIAVRTNGP